MLYSYHIVSSMSLTHFTISRVDLHYHYTSALVTYQSKIVYYTQYPMSPFTRIVRNTYVHTQ